jgi:hypothetical protein
LFLLWGCDIPRDNPLDPKNPDSCRSRKIMIEAFVNLETGSPYDAYMTAALDSLVKRYPDRVLVAEYYRNVQNFKTPYHLSENDVLYGHYLEVFQDNLKGLPDVFINGTEARIQGASSMEAALFRLQQGISSRITDISEFSMEMAYSVNGSQITPTVTLARLGNSDAEVLLVKIVLISRMDNLHRRVVTASVKSPRIAQLDHGEIQKINLSPIQIDFSVDNSLLAFVCDEDERIISQCESIRVKP